MSRSQTIMTTPLELRFLSERTRVYHALTLCRTAIHELRQARHCYLAAADVLAHRAAYSDPNMLSEEFIRRAQEMNNHAMSIADGPILERLNGLPKKQFSTKLGRQRYINTVLQ